MIVGLICGIVCLLTGGILFGMALLLPDEDERTLNRG